MTEEEKELAKEKAKENAKKLLETSKKVAKQGAETAIAKAGELKEVVEEKVQEYEEATEDLDEETKKKNALIGLGVVIFCGFLLVTVVSSIFGAVFGGSGIGEKDHFHLMHLQIGELQKEMGKENNMVNTGSLLRVFYDDVTIEASLSGYVKTVQVTGKSLELAGCTISDSLKTIEKNMKKMDGGYQGNKAEIVYDFLFFYDDTPYKLTAMVEDNGKISMLILSEQ